MATATTILIEEAIHAVAVRRLGAADATIVRVVDRDNDPQIGGVWFSLSVRLPGDSEWKPLGRRRTKRELLELVSTLDPRHLDGKHFP
jgi:hypothetical protein